MTESSYSKLRDFLIPDTKNTLQSASFQHSQGNFDAAEDCLKQAETKIKKCREQLQKDRENGNS
jgi:hypothetical protein